VSDTASRICDQCAQGPAPFKHLPVDKKEVSWLCFECETKRLEVRSE
jgi:hypothetical protein